MITRSATNLLLSTLCEDEDDSDVTVIMPLAELRATLEIEAALAARENAHTRPTIEMVAVRTA